MLLPPYPFFLEWRYLLHPSAFTVNPSLGDPTLHFGKLQSLLCHSLALSLHLTGFWQHLLVSTPYLPLVPHGQMSLACYSNCYTFLHDWLHILKREDSEGKINVAWLWKFAHLSLFQQRKECSPNQKEEEFRRLNSRVLLPRSFSYRKHKLVIYIYN